VTIRAATLVGIVMALCGTGLAQKVQFDPTEKDELLEGLKNPPESDQERAARIKALFAKAGCGGNLLQEQPLNGASSPNIICELRGQSAESVIVGAHYDQASSAERPIDNWNSAFLLPAIYHSLRNRKRRHTFIFVAFADHGSDVSGANFFIDRMTSAEVAHVEAMVNLDVLGLSPTKVWSSHSNKELVQDLVTMVYALKLPASQIDMEEAGNSDANPFTRQQIPNITIHSLTQENLAAGTATPFRPDNYYDSYRLICGYLAYLDVILKARPHSE
jgi:hypothetical protein